MSTTPGRGVAAEQREAYATLEAEEGDPTTADTLEVGGVASREVVVEEVRVDGDVADYDFNVNLNGNAVFASAQSPAGTSEESFVPDSANKRAAGVDAAQVQFEITSVGSAGTVQVLVLVRYVPE